MVAAGLALALREVPRLPLCPVGRSVGFSFAFIRVAMGQVETFTPSSSEHEG